MRKYPALSTISGVVTVVGWLVLVAGGLAFVFALMSVLNVSNNPVGAIVGVSSIFSSAQLALFGLLLAANGELIKVFIDIEANTSRIAGPAPSSTAPIANGTPSAVASELPYTPIAIPPGFQRTADHPLERDDRIFDFRYGEGVVVRRGRNRYFVIVRFDQDGAEIEREALSLYYQK